MSTDGDKYAFVNAQIKGPTIQTDMHYLYHGTQFLRVKGKNRKKRERLCQEQETEETPHLPREQREEK